MLAEVRTLSHVGVEEEARVWLCSFLDQCDKVARERQHSLQRKQGFGDVLLHGGDSQRSQVPPVTRIFP